MPPDPKRGEVWRVDLEPAIGSEMQKARPCVVVNANNAGRLPLRLVVPLTGWNLVFAGYPWCVQIIPSAVNGLTKPSSADTFQIRSVSLLRMGERLGELPEAEMKAIAQAVAVCVNYKP